MARFCTQCGLSLNQQSSFCTRCGTPAYNQIQQKKKMNKWVKLSIILGVTLVFVSASIFGVYKVGQITGYWHQRAINKGAEAWKSQKAFKTEEKEIFELFDNLQVALGNSNIDLAMNYFYPDEKDRMHTLLSENLDKLPTLVSMLDSKEITYLSEEETDYYYVSKFAFVRIGEPINTQTSEGTTIISVVKTENGWVVEDIQ